MDRPLQIRIDPSRIARAYSACVLLLALLAVAVAAIPFPLQCLLAVTVCVYGSCVLRELCRPPVRTLERIAGQWHLQTGDGQVDALLAPPAFVAFGVVSLRFVLPCGNRKRVFLWPDSSDADSLRRLRRALQLS